MKKAVALFLALVLAVSMVVFGSNATEADTEKTLTIGIRVENTHDMLNFHLTGAGDDYYYS